MRLSTWNVLHRIHAENWGEPVIAAWPDEAARVAAITARVAATLDEVICLQEVSGDQVASLRGALADRCAVLAAPYPRIPHRRAATRTGAALADPAEHLVTIVRGGPARVVAGAAFDDDPGKGYLAIELGDGTWVVNTHVTFGAPGRRQVAELVAVARSAPRVAIAGDWNAEWATVAEYLGAGTAVARPAEPALPSRPRAEPGGVSRTIDHVAVRGLACERCAVVDAGGLSDHHLVSARLGEVPA